LADRNEIAATERKFVDALIAGSGELAHLIALAWVFRTMIREQQEERLDRWLVVAGEMALAGFASELGRDLAHESRLVVALSCGDLVDVQEKL
jgi:hypothetical protein